MEQRITLVTLGYRTTPVRRGFRDLDGHACEIAYNPGFGLHDDGNIVLPTGA